MGLMSLRLVDMYKNGFFCLFMYGGRLVSLVEDCTCLSFVV